MSKRSPPAMPPAVLTNTADNPSVSGEGKRTRSEPDSWSWRRRVTPSCRCASNATAPRARLAAKIAEAALVISLRIRPHGRVRRHQKFILQRHLPTDFTRVEIAAIASIFHGAPVHDCEIVAELAGKVEILFDEEDCDVAEAAKI